MLFNSPEFIGLFLPAFLLIFYFCMRFFKHTVALTALVGASFFFYGVWNPPYLLLLLLSIGINYAGYRGVIYYRSENSPKAAKAIAGAIVIIDLCSIGYFKYFNFFSEQIASLLRIPFRPYNIFLPLGISFFTFQSIAFVIDSLKKDNYQTEKCSLLEFAAFISFFPQLIAGPIVHADELIPQLRDRDAMRFSLEKIANGGTIFFIGLAKKILLADTLSPYVNEIFGAAEKGDEITFFVALYGMLAYSLQLYFDFSGYSDMAYGLALMIGIKLPVNFNSPYKSGSLVVFWSRWHITLSRFLRDYVYIPLGGNRHGMLKRFRNLLATMLIGGIWHGAGWTFIVWGGLHGIGLVINHLWKHLSERNRFLGRCRESAAWTFFSSVLTLIFVFMTWIIFRSKNWLGVKMMYKGLCGLNGAVLPNQIVNLMPEFLRHIIRGSWDYRVFGATTFIGFAAETISIFSILLIALFGTNVYNMGKKTKYFLIVLAFYFVLQKLLFAAEQTEFLYFQF